MKNTAESLEDGTASAAIEADQTPADELANARAIVDGLAGALKSDSGAAFAEPMLKAMALVKHRAPEAWARAKTALQKAKVSVRDVEKAMANDRAATLHVVPSDTTQPPLTAGIVLGEDCPAPDLIVPSGFSLQQNATTKFVRGLDGEEPGREIVIAHAPVLIVARLHDIDDGSQSLDLRFRRPDGWHSIIVDRAVPLNSRQITQLASHGFPVASTTANDLVGYIHDLEGLNYHRIPTTWSTSHLGWQGKDGEGGFLCGRTLVLPDGSSAPGHGAGHAASSPIVFVGSAPGDEQIADSLCAKGSMAGWLSAIKPIAGFPRVLLGLYASFVPPLLRILGAPNPIIDWWNRTSTGKTTVLRVAASVWGNPDEQSPDSFIGCWDSTEVFIERASSILTGLPVLLDETKRAKDFPAIGKILYGVAQGRGRSRGNVKSTARTGAWRTALLSTGEAPATSFTQDGGTRARVLEVGGQPFGRADEETANLVQTLNAGLKANFGHAGPLFVQWLIENRSCWGWLRENYQAAVAEYSAMLPVDRSRIDLAVVSRLAQSAAAIEVAALCVHGAIELPWWRSYPLEMLWPEIVAGTGTATGDERALKDVVSWAHSQRETFWSSNKFSRRSTSLAPPSSAGWSGRWDRGEDWAFIGFYPHLLKRLLRDFGYAPEAIFAGWKERGWLDVGRNRVSDKSVRVGDQNPCLIVIRREAISAIESEA